MPHTRADLLRSSITFALMKAKIHGRKGVLTDAQRDEIASHVIAHLRNYGDPWRLDEELPLFFHGPSVPWSPNDPGFHKKT